MKRHTFASTHTHTQSSGTAVIVCCLDAGQKHQGPKSSLCQLQGIWHNPHTHARACKIDTNARAHTAWMSEGLGHITHTKRPRAEWQRTPGYLSTYLDDAHTLLFNLLFVSGTMMNIMMLQLFRADFRHIYGINIYGSSHWGFMAAETFEG